MSTMIMNAPPARKPVPGRAPQQQQPAPGSSYTMQQPKQPPAPYGQQQQQHGRTRTNSSSVIPYNGTTPSPPNNVSPAYSMTQQHPPQNLHAQYPSQQQRRTLSNATSSTTSTNANPNPNPSLQRIPTSSGFSTATSNIRRSTSSRSNGSSASPTSYVALMRKQKGTVWCDRAQNEDPRIMAAQRQAKMRAAAEVAGGHNYASIRTSTGSTGVVGGVRSKIRHHGAPKASAYNATVVSGAGVPMRLSASEVDDGNESDEETPRHHTRNGSGRSSLGSGRKGYGYQTSNLQHSYSNGSTPPAHSPVDSMGELKEEQTPMATDHERDSYFERSEYEAGDEEKFDSVPGLPKPRGPSAEEKANRQSTAEDLRRRGSVDDRTMTMSNVRLYVANPDLSD